jgi:methionyl-tRNA formyltransferase
MRIEFVTQEDPLYILPLFEEFLKLYSDRFTIARISSCPTMGSRSRQKMVRELSELYGLLGFARLASRVLVSRVLGTVRLGRRANRYYSLPQLCRAFGIEFASIGNPNAPEFVEGARARNCDLIISVACPYIVKPPVLDLPRLGWINIHHAPLPRYKGMMPTFWQLYHGEKSVGLTIHRMAAKVDDGAALLQEQLAVQPDESLDHLIRRSKRHAAHRLANVLEEMAAGKVPTVTSADATSTYFTFPTHAEIREFRRRGLRAI